MPTSIFRQSSWAQYLRWLDGHIVQARIVPRVAQRVHRKPRVMCLAGYLGLGLRPCLGDISEMAAKRAFPKAKSDHVFGQRRKPSKMFRVGLYARVSTNDQQILPMPSRAMRDYAALRGWTITVQSEIARRLEIGRTSVRRVLASVAT